MNLPDPAAKLLAQRAWLDKVQARVRAKCPDSVAEKVNVMNVEGDNLIITVPNSAIATQMRWLMSKLYESLCVEIPGFKGRFKGVLLRLRDTNVGHGMPMPGDPKPPAPPRPARKIRSDAAAAAYATAAAISDGRLRRKLLDFITNHAED